ncbi:YjbQ family protein [Neisseriaceae bacterium PsAf]|nr:YjbQ family protein [Neisseriaceae bacterium PsAf]
MWLQKKIILNKKHRGVHLITQEILQHIPEIQDIKIGLLHLFLQHTSAGLTINENADSSVRTDFESFFNDVVSENKPYYQHTYEGQDDMPAHPKSSILGNQLSIPITQGKLNLGIWQGIYLCEHRYHASQRIIIATIHGEV